MKTSLTDGRSVDAEIVDQAVQEDLGREVMVREWPDLAAKLQSVKAALAQIADGALVKAREFSKVTDPESRALAAGVGIQCAMTVKIIKKARELCYEPLKKECDGFRAVFDEPLKTLKLASDTAAAGIDAYKVEEARKARIEQEAREAEARRQQEEYERKKREYEAELSRIKAEADRKEKERLDAIEAERKRKIKEEEDARLAYAAEAEAQGNEAKVDIILAKATPIAAPAPVLPPIAAPAPVLPPPPPPPPAPAPVAIMAKRPDPNEVSVVRWHWTGTNLRALARAVGEGRAPLEYITANRAPITSDVTRLKDEFKCDGIEAYPETKTHFKA